MAAYFVKHRVLDLDRPRLHILASRCGMKSVAGIPDPVEYHLDLTVTPHVPKSGDKAHLKFDVHDPWKNNPVKKFNIVHEKLFHAFIVSEDLQVFVQDHPTWTNDAFQYDMTFRKPGMYRVLGDFYPEGSIPWRVGPHACCKRRSNRYDAYTSVHCGWLRRNSVRPYLSSRAYLSSVGAIPEKWTSQYRPFRHSRQAVLAVTSGHVTSTVAITGRWSEATRVSASVRTRQSSTRMSPPT
jgi:hypothetical protein